VLGKIERQNVVVLQGRFHFYEGYTMWGITFPVRVLAKLGIKTLIVTGACGGLREGFKSGELVVLKDHLNLMPANPLIGPHVSEMGPRFVDMSEPYDVGLIAQAKEAAENLNIALQIGVYAAVAGPNYETGAETAMLKKLGADVVGMSIVPEVIVARQMGLQVLGLTVVSNEHGQQKAVSHEKVLENVGKTSTNFVKLLQTILKGEK
jgi:purine-nucleoside phosphorylase